jgi:hypothetical protein
MGFSQHTSIFCCWISFHQCSTFIYLLLILYSLRYWWCHKIKHKNKHNSRTTAGYTCRVQNWGHWQMYPTIRQLLGSVCQVTKGPLWRTQNGIACKCCHHWEKNIVRKPSDYTFYVTAHCEKSKPENEILYKQGQSKTTQTVLNAWHRITPSAPQLFSTRSCYSYNFMFVMVSTLVLYSGPWFESWLHSFPWPHNTNIWTIF